MLARFPLVALVFALAVAAKPRPARQASEGDVEFEAEECNGGTVQCCNALEEVEGLNNGLKGALKLAGVDVPRLTGHVGFGCTAVNVLAVGGGSKWYVPCFFCKKTELILMRML